MAQKIDYGLAFNFWVRAVLKNILRIISLAKNRNARYLKKNHKFVIYFPKYVSQVYALDENNENTLWDDGIDKDMKNVSPVFSKLDNG